MPAIMEIAVFFFVADLRTLRFNFSEFVLSSSQVVNDVMKELNLDPKTTLLAQGKNFNFGHLGK